jgi:hypothetical protein
MSETYYAALDELVDARAIPGDLTFLENNAQAVIDELLGKIFYKDLAVEVTDNGDTKHYRLVLLTKSIRQSLFGTGLELVFFKGAETEMAEFPILFEWRWPVQKFIAGFEAEGFSYAPEAFIDILFRMAGISSTNEFVGAITGVFLEDGNDTYSHFMDALIAKANALSSTEAGAVAAIEQVQTNLGILKTELTAVLSNSNFFTITDIYQNYQEHPAIAQAITAIEEAIDTLTGTHDFSINIYSELAQAALKQVTGIDDKFSKLLQLFKSWLGEFSLDDVEQLLVPQFSLRLSNINMALEFPRDMLLPMVENGGHWQVDPDATHKAAVVFTAGEVFYSTQSGLSTTIDETNQIDLPRCMLPDLGLQLELKKIKPDLNRESNIAEVVADDRPENFIGVFVQEANIFLPDQWFQFDEDGSTLQLYGRDIIAGTGGLSGRIGLKAVAGTDPVLQASQLLTDGRTLAIDPGSDSAFGEGDAVRVNGTAAEDGRYILKDGGTVIAEGGSIKQFIPSDGELTYKLGKSGSSFWKIGFSEFHMKFRQNNIEESEIKGSLTIPNFIQEGKTEDLRLDIAVFFEPDGDFKITATSTEGVVLCLGENGKVFKLKVKSLAAGKDNDKVFLEVSGDIDFSNNPLLNKFLTKPIEIKKLRIYSDGGFDLEGGSIPVPGSLHMNLGPVEVAITNITLGAETLSEGSYKFLGFDCGLSTGSGGLDLRGDGIKVYFNHDGSDMFLRIAGIGIDLIIPGSANEESAALILKGYLSLKEDEYVGAVSFKLPKVKIAGGAAMKMKPAIPAFAVDAFIELSTPIPVGPTGLGIYGFRGLFGLRYIADLPPGATSDPDKLFGYYTAKKPNPLNGNLPEKGLHLGKIVTPDQRTDQFRSSGTPISIGAGVSLGTAMDAGRIFSMQAFLFLSLPELFMISGRGNVLKERVSLVSANEPPFFAYLAFTSEFVSVGMGANYKVREGEGQFLELNAEAQMAFFFNDASAWYVHFGTKEEPNKAKLLKKIFSLDAYAYMVISAAGIETGAGVSFKKSKKYGPVQVNIDAHGDVYAMISFRKVQAGGGIACGGTIGASVFGIGFDLTLDAYLMATAPKPFIVKGGMEFCLKVDFWLYTWKKCINLDFTWEFDLVPDLSEIRILDIIPFPVSGMHLGSNTPYKLTYFNNALPQATDATIETVPLDTFIDIQLKKPVSPAAVAAKIGGYTNPPAGNTELVPPKEVQLQVTHRFDITDVKIKVWNRFTNTWVDYHPYEALDNGAFLQNVNPANLKIGYWQKKGKEYNQLRLLCNTPFSYTGNGTGTFIPEQSGVNAGTMFCQGTQKQWHCVKWEDVEQVYAIDKWHVYRDVTFRVDKFPATVIPYSNPYNIPFSLCIDNESKFELIFPEKVLAINLKFCTDATTLYVSYYDLQDEVVEYEDGSKRLFTNYVLIRTEERTYKDCGLPLKYESDSEPIKKIVFEAQRPSGGELKKMKDQLVAAKYAMMAGDKSAERSIKAISEKLEILGGQSCGGIIFEKRKAGILGDGGYEHCSTYIHEICYLTQQEYWYNQDIPSQADIDQEYEDMADAINKVIAPIWRPDETYAIEVKTRERINSTPNDRTSYFAFKTAGPLGHFPLKHLPAEKRQQFNLNNNGEPVNPGTDFDKRVEVAENNLKFYIDFKRSYPNPIGNIINQKPLYYHNPDLQLFFTEPSAYHFFSNWPNYQGLGAKKSTMEWEIKDPAENGAPTNALVPVTPVQPTAVLTWVKDTQPLAYTNVTVVNALRNPRLNNPAFNSETCWKTGGDPIVPASNQPEVKVQDLKPAKLYTAVVFNKYAKDGVTFERKQVHSYPFQTSRYASLEEQVNSYHLKEIAFSTGNVLSTKDAVYDIPVDLVALNTTLAELKAVATGADVTSSTRPELIQSYPDAFERICFGYLQMTPLHPAQNTEINFLRNSDDALLAVQVRNPEPFNDPRIARETLQQTVQLIAAANPALVTTAVFSRDNSEVLLFHDLTAEPASLQLTFNYLVWNGNTYTAAQTITTDNLIIPAL